MKKEKAFTGDALSLILRKAHSMVNAFESIPFNIPNNSADSKLSRAIALSNFQNVRAKMGQIVSMSGKAAIGLIPYYDAYKQMQTYIATPFSVFYWKSTGAQENYVLCNTYDTITIGSGSSIKEMNIYALYNWSIATDDEPSVPQLRKVYYIDNIIDDPYNEDNIVALEIYKFPWMKILPVKIFKNNFDMTSDVIEYGVFDDLKNLEAIGSDFLAQYNRSKNLFYINKNYSDLDITDLSNEIDNGSGEIEEYSPNSKAGGGVQMLAQNSGLAINITAHEFLYSHISQKLGLSASDQMESGGQNKHSLEIIVRDEYSMNILLRKYETRKAEWLDFFLKYCLTLKVAIVEPELKLNEILQAKVAFMKASIMAVQAGANGTPLPQAQQAGTNQQQIDKTATSDLSNVE